jgi:folate-dependent phosphoribosylglycinamide formyltransferase PurN
MKTILLTSTFGRHHYVANTLAAGCDLAGVWQEERSFHHERFERSDAEQRVIDEYFSDAEASEARYFADHGEVTAAVQVRRVPVAGCNDRDEVARMVALEPDVVLVFETGILRDAILSTFAGRIINIHFGLSPYYRGSRANFWALVNREPECVGATIHHLDATIDHGPILLHARPAIEAADSPHDIGNKTIVAAAGAALKATAAHQAGWGGARPQMTRGRLYQRGHFGADAVRRLYRNFENGMIGEYLKNRAARDAALRLIEPSPAVAVRQL